MNSREVRAHGLVSGRVQGVCFRMAARDEAQRLRLKGWVRNLPDGSVETLVEGVPEAVGRYLAWCREGPAFACVTDVKETRTAAAGDLSGFEIRY